MSNEIFLLYHEYEYGEKNIHNATKILGAYTTSQNAIDAINRYHKIEDFNKLSKKYFKISKFILDNDTWYLNGFDVSCEASCGIKRDKYSKIYSEISFYGKNDSFIDDLNNIIKVKPTKTGKIGEVLKSKIVRDENLWEFKTKTIKTYDLSDVSNELCNFFYDKKDELRKYVIKNNCDVRIYFVLDIGEDGICLDIDKKIMEFALTINAKIYFDGL